MFCESGTLLPIKVYNFSLLENGTTNTHKNILEKKLRYCQIAEFVAN